MSSDAELLGRYVPFLQYDSLESYPADSVAVMTDCVPVDFPQGNALRRGWRTALAWANPGPGEARLTPGFLRGESYPDAGQSRVRAGDHLDAMGKRYVEDARRMHTRPGCANQIYGYANRNQEGALWLQYWLFFYYNDKALLGSGNHEGDWELVQLKVGADERPVTATYSQHKSGERCDWTEVEKEVGPGGAAPVVYVARGSHACYFRPGVYPQAPIVPDHCDARGPRVRPQLNVIADDDPDWVTWPGRWGSTRHWRILTFLGADSPPGPRQHSSWRDPLGFHRAAREAHQLGPMVGEDLAKPAAPAIEARREGGRAVVSYQLPAPGPAAPKPKQLVLSLDGEEDGMQPATYSFDVKGEQGTIELPLELEDRAYTVRAAAAARNGITGRAASTELSALAD